MAGSSVPKTDPLGVDLIEGDRVLSVRLVAESRPQISVSTAINNDQRGVDISFEFLDVNDGFIIEVLHEVHAAPRLRGSIPGANVTEQADVDLSPRGREALRKSWWARFRTRYRTQAIAVLIALWVAFAVLLTMGLLDALGAQWRTAIGVRVDDPPAFNGWMVALYSCAVAFIVFYFVDLARRFRRRVPRSVVANDYEASFDWTPAEGYDDGSGRVFRVGDMIEHPDFGSGIIQRLDGSGRQLILIVAFENSGTKKLLAKIAPVSFVTNIHGEDA